MRRRSSRPPGAWPRRWPWNEPDWTWETSEAGPFDEVWIQPAAGDAGGALGAAMITWHQVLDNPRQAQPRGIQQGSYLGPSFSGEEIETTLEKMGAKWTVVPWEELPRRVAEIIADDPDVDDDEIDDGSGHPTIKQPKGGRFVVEAAGERELDEDSVDGGVRIPLVQDRQDVLLRGLRRKTRIDIPDSDLGALLFLHSDVDPGRRVLADQHDSQTGLDPLLTQGIRLDLHLRPNGSGDLVAIYDLCGHRILRGGSGSNGLSRAPDQRAKFTARVSRTTTTLICPGYWSSSSILRAVFSLNSAISSSVIFSGMTRIRISRPAWIA